MAEPNEMIGGQGESRLLPTSDGHHDRADMRLLLRAVKNGWVIPDNLKVDIPCELERIMRDGTAGTRERLRAMELLSNLDGSNFTKLLEYVKRTPEGAEQHAHRFVSYIKGIDESQI